MKIGIDVDGVILDSEKEFRIRAELYDVINLKRNSIIDNNELKIQGRYNWNQYELENYINREFLKASEECNFMPGAIKVINLLKNEGHEFILISARGRKEDPEGMLEIGKTRLEEEGISFNKTYWAAEDKLSICKNEKVDIMIDDFYKTCKQISDNKIKTLYFREYPNYELEENDYLKEVHNWGEIYRYIKEIGGNNAR